MKFRAALFIPLLAVFYSLYPVRISAHTLQDEALAGVGVDEKPGVQLPLDLVFTDQDGKTVRLGEYFTGGPVILSLNYYSCPLLCPVIFRNLAAEVDIIKGLSLNSDYRIVTVSIDPEETLARARAKAGETWRMLPGIRNPGERWPFLIGGEQPLARLAAAVGVRYKRLGKNNFAHPSVMVVLTPAGKVARYLYGIEQRPSDLKLALIEAADGKIGGSRLLNQVLLYCFHYDPAGKRYAVTAINLMKITGAAMLAMLGILLFVLWRKERTDGRHAPGKG